MPGVVWFAAGVVVGALLVLVAGMMAVAAKWDQAEEDAGLARRS